MLLVGALLMVGPAQAGLAERMEWTVVDVGGQTSTTVPDEARKLAEGGSLDAEPAGLALHLRVVYVPDGRATRLKVHVADESGRDRGLVVRLSLALPRGEWQWAENLDQLTPLGDEPLSNTAALRELPNLPEFTEGDRPDYGRYSAYPLGVVEANGVWMALARPLDQLALVRFIGERGRLTAEVDFALSEFTSPPREAAFELTYLTGNAPPSRGMRAALAAGDIVAPPAEGAPRRGGWMPFADLGGIPNVDEFGFGYQEGGSNARFDDGLGVASFVYFHCAGEFANVDGYRRGTEPLPPYETVMAALNRAAQASSGIEGVWDICGIQGPDGKVAYRPERTYGDVFCQACVDPELPYGKAMADRLIARVTQTPYPEGIDGCYYDGIAAGLDYAPEHLRVADHLLLWDGALNRPVNYNLWSSIEWAQHIHEALAGTGKLTMLNDSSLVAFTFAGPYIDVPGGEMSLYLQRDECRLIRALLGSKPFCTLVKADFSQVSPAQIETYMRRCAAYGILFGFFDISPSGDHPGSSYWEHPEWYDRDRALFRRYMPLAAELITAGWRPDPGARISGEAAFVERFGENGLAYVTVSTDPTADVARSRRVKLRLDPPNTEGARVAVELLTGRVEAAGELGLEMTGEDLQVWAIGSEEAQREACLRRARAVLDRREQYLVAMRATGDSLAPWVAYGEEGGRLVSPGHESDFALLAEKDQPGLSAGANLTTYVEHEEPRKLVASAWSRAENVAGERDQGYSLYVDCYYADGTALYGQTVDFATGTHDWQFGERVIEPAKPIRNINVYLLFRGAHTGRVWFDDVRVALADDPETNLLTRGGFEPTRAGAPLAGDSRAARTLNASFARLWELCDGRNPNWGVIDHVLADLEARIAATDWGPDTERSRRDLEDLRWHLNLARAVSRPQPAQRPSRQTELVALDLPRVTTGPVQYEANTGHMPPGTLIVVDSNFEGYSAQPLTDGRVNPQQAHWTQVAWASEESGRAHWIELRFPQPTPVREVRLWGAADSGTLHVPQQIEAQVSDGGTWTAIPNQRIERGESGLLTLHLPGTRLGRLRLAQPPHGGSPQRPDLMWITEVECHGD
jgi:hypothetical protein